MPILSENDIIIRSDDAGGIIRPEYRASGKRVHKSVPPDGQGLGEFSSGLDGDVQQPNGRVGEVADGIHAMRLAGDDFDGNATIIRLDERDLVGAKIAVPRLTHLELLGQIHPQLQADVRGSILVHMGHLGMHDPLSGRHELQIARSDGALVAGEILVVDAARQEVRDGFLAPVRVVGESGAFADGEMVQHEEWAEMAEFLSPHRSTDTRAGALGLFDGEEDLPDRSRDSHV